MLLCRRMVDRNDRDLVTKCLQRRRQMFLI